MTQLGSLVPELAELGVEVAAIGVTATFSQMAFARSIGAVFPLLSDWDGEVSGAYGVRYEEWKGHVGVAKRSLFVIDVEGVVRHRWSTDDALELPDMDEILGWCRQVAESPATEARKPQ